ncbi:hypothetical protein [Streptomyces sp. NPDC091371]|uniref:NAD(P)/FAD-dependent oxidoreductase n=1 Tax=Streptomyces sp. NPDC091371 TaxID=3155303 RepID=UPI003411FA08
MLRQRAPHLLDAAQEEGARLLDLTEAAPTEAFDKPADDHELVALAVRRPLLELLLHRAVRALPGVAFGHGTAVRGLLLDPARSRVAGVVTDRGERVPARFVVDATGWKAAALTWLRKSRAPIGEDLVGTTQLRCFSRFYRLNAPGGDWPGPLNRGNAAGGIWDHYAAVVHPADNGTFAISVGALTSDPATTILREPAAFTAAARLSPYVAAWIEEGTATPLTDVHAITMPPNIMRSTARPGQRQIAGLFAVGDAACVTDPLFGRGMSLSLQHAFRLADLLDAHPTVGEHQSENAVRLAEEVHRPWYEQAVHDSRAYGGLWRARAEGLAPSPVPPAVQGRPSMADVARAAAVDAVVWRGFVRVLMGLDTPAEILDSAGFQDRVRTAPADRAPIGARPPTRQELLEAITARREG